MPTYQYSCSKCGEALEVYQSFSDEPLRRHSGCGGKLDKAGETALDAPILGELEECHREVVGSAPRTHGVSYGSDLRLFTRYAEMPAVLYGPGDVRLAHSANEKVPLEELVRAAEVLGLLVARAL